MPPEKEQTQKHKNPNSGTSALIPHLRLIACWALLITDHREGQRKEGREGGRKECGLLCPLLKETRIYKDSREQQQQQQKMYKQ